MNSGGTKENEKENYRKELYNLFIASYENLMRYAYAITGDRLLTEDIVQEAFLHAYESYIDYDDWGKILPRLYDFIRNEAMIYLKINSLEQVKQEVPSRGPTQRLSIPEEHLFHMETRKQVVYAINRLKPHLKNIIMMRYYGKLSMSEIAEATNLPLDRIKRFLKEAKEEIYKELDINCKNMNDIV